MDGRLEYKMCSSKEVMFVGCDSGMNGDAEKFSALHLFHSQPNTGQTQSRWFSSNFVVLM
jgi:hypothetical protein